MWIWSSPAHMVEDIHEKRTIWLQTFMPFVTNVHACSEGSGQTTYHKLLSSPEMHRTGSRQLSADAIPFSRAPSHGPSILY